MRNFYPDFETLGVLVCERREEPPFAEASFLRSLIRAGNRARLRIFAFDPSTWRDSDNTVRAWTEDVDGIGWCARNSPLPKLVFDRSWPESESGRERFRLALRRIADVKGLRYLNGKLPDKAGVYSVLAKDSRIAGLLPPTGRYAGPGSLAEWLDRHDGAAFLKPAAGSQGRRVAACTRQDDGWFRMRGRTGGNRPFDLTFRGEREAADRLQRWIGGRRYLLQPLLELRGSDDEPFDIRALVQKNGKGRWTMTGAAARSGRSGTVTSNLHGGGTAISAEEKLSVLFGPSGAARLMRQIRGACAAIVNRLEHYYGRFAELGLDFGVDRSGRLWFLEANSKPGRASMAGIGAAASKAAVDRPVAYARSILLRPPGRVVHEFDHL